ncbi:MAG: glycolate oxidase subunit GlcE [Thioploca sp.]|nr:glycolate oxidase subunit GlcE [Thioploca sp.]
MSSDISAQLQESVQTAMTQSVPLKIVGGQSKAFYGRAMEGQILSIAGHQGIISYEPSELVITARAGTPLQEISQTLAAQGQCLAFDPPHFGETATWGGTIACGLSGPARPYQGAARDFVLGVKCLNGKGEILRFGGQVMKNVAGYDVSRLMVGALGTLGVLLEISCKVLPLPAEEITLVKPMTSEKEALAQMIFWGNQTVPLTASCFDGEKLLFRLGGIAIQPAQQKIPAEVWNEGNLFWIELREQRLPFFTAAGPPLWRLSVPPTTPPLELSEEKQLIEWGGALRWLRSDLPAETIRAIVAQVGGHATLFRGGDRTSEVFHPLANELEKLHRRLKEQFDPRLILNPRRMAMNW